MLSSGKDQRKESDEVSFAEVLQNLHDWKIFLLNRWKKILLLVISGVIIGVMLSFFLKPKYRAVTTFVLENTKKSGLGEYASIASKLGFSASSSSGGVFQDDDNIMSFIKSRRIIGETLYSTADFSGKKQLLIERYAAFNGYLDDWKDEPKLANLRFAENGQRSYLEDSLTNEFHRQILKKILIVDKPDKDEDVIMIATTTIDQHFSKAFNEKLVENLSKFYVNIQTRKVQENVNILKFQVDSVQSILNTALMGAAYTNEANPNPNPAFQRLKVPTQKKVVEVEINKAILEELVKQLELARIALRKETPLIQLIDEPILPLEEKRLGIIKGIVLGAFLGGFFAVAYFSLRYFIQRLRYS